MHAIIKAKFAFLCRKDETVVSEKYYRGDIVSSYSLTQWILFFFVYGFAGWIWECFLVSAKYIWKEKQWKFFNRGFLHGPFIPIYGFAAVTILLTTIRLRENICVVYLVGALTATLFELVTGTVMEKLFKVKYWDYSNLPLNYHGHICLFVSLFWGLFSVLLVAVVHVPVENFLMRMPVIACEIVAFVLVAVFMHDVTVSFNEAMDLREILESLSENNETMKRIEQRIARIAAYVPVSDKEDWSSVKSTVKENLANNVERFRWQNEERINRLKESLQRLEYDALPERGEFLEKLERHRKRILEKSSKQFLRARRQLRRNPGVKSAKYQATLDQLKDLLKKRD